MRGNERERDKEREQRDIHRDRERGERGIGIGMLTDRQEERGKVIIRPNNRQ